MGAIVSGVCLVAMFVCMLLAAIGSIWNWNYNIMRWLLTFAVVFFMMSSIFMFIK